MKRPIVFPAMLLLLGFTGCVKKVEAPIAPGALTVEPFTARVQGYRTMVQVKAGPAELEKYLMDPKILEMTTGLFTMSQVSGRQFENIGDSAEYDIAVFGFSFRIKAILIHHRPQKEIWYAAQGGKAVMIFRFKMEPVDDSTHLSLSCETLEEGDESFKKLTKLINFYDLLAKGFETVLANLQVHFNPALSADQLLKEGIRGEFFEAIYTGHRASMLLEATPEQIVKTFSDPAFWSYFEQNTGARVGACFYEFSPGPCPVAFAALGFSEPLSLIRGPYNPARNIYNYYYLGDSRFQVSFTPLESGSGALFNFFYEEPPPDWSSSAIASMVLRYGKAPELVENLMGLVKNYVEGRVPSNPGGAK
jgi:hypothetical protein